MNAALRSAIHSLAILAAGAPALLNCDAREKAPAPGKGAEYADPKSTYRTYLEAIRKNDTPAAKKCWALDDDDTSGVLDVLVGRYTALRRLNQLAVKKFGQEGSRAIPKRWRLEEVTDEAIDLTKNRLGKAVVTIKGGKAELVMKREKEDASSKPAFEGSEEPIPFRKVGKAWKIDANALLDVKRGDSFFKEDWKPPLGVIFSGQMVIANEAVDGIQKRKLKTAKELKAFIERRWKAWPEEYAGWLKKYIEERKRADSKRKEGPNRVLQRTGAKRPSRDNDPPRPRR